MDESFEQTQALNFEEEEECETEEDINREHRPVGTLKVQCQKGFPEKSFPLFEGDNVIGRHESCNISIPLKALSREHACIEIKGESVFIYDKISRNRTRRNKHFLAAEVRYELKDKDRLTFGDVECVYHQAEKQNEPDDSGSETGSESMFETAPINETIEETKEQATLRLPVDTDYHSDASSDILEPTQPFGSQKQSSLLKNNNSTLMDQNKTHNVTVKDTPAPTRTKRIMENIVLPESGSETDTEDDSRVAPTLAPESQYSDEDTPKKKTIMGAATQTYICESDADTEEEVTPTKKALLLAATQAYVEEDDSEETPRKQSILTAATQAYVGESEESGDEQETPVKLKRKIVLEPTQAYTLATGIEPTQAYTLATGIEPTQAYDMDVESNDGSKEEVEQADTKTKSLLFEPTQAYVGEAEDDEPNEEGEESKSVMYEPTQAYPGKDKDGAESDTSEEFVLDDEADKDDDDDEDVSQIFMAPTLACDDVEDSNESVPSRDDNQEMETQEVAEDQTQVVEETDKKQAHSEDATQVFTDDATQAIGKSKKKIDGDNDGETQVVTDETQVLHNKKTISEKEVSEEEATQVFTDDTQVADDEKKKPCKHKLAGDEPTQVITDDTQVFDEESVTHKRAKIETTTEDATQVVTDIQGNEALPGVTRGKLDDDSEQPTQVFSDATMAIEDLCLQNKVQKSQVKAVEDATQVFQDTDEDDRKGKQTRGKRTKGLKRAVADNDTEPSTQICDDEKDTKTSENVNIANEDATQLFSEPVPEDDSEKEIIMHAISTLAAEEYDGDVGKKKTDFDSEAATQVVDDILEVDELKTVACTDTVDVSETSAIAETAKIEETAIVAITEPTLPVSNAVQKSKTKGRGKKTGKGKMKANSEIASEGNESATQVLDNTETLPITEIEEKMPGQGVNERNKHVPEFEPETQIYTEKDEEKINESTVNKTATQILEKPSRRSARQSKRNIQKEEKTAEDLDEVKEDVSKARKITTKTETKEERSGSTRSRSRRGQQPAVEESNKLTDKASKAAKVKDKRKKEQVVIEEAAQAYIKEEEAATQRYGDGDEGSSTSSKESRSVENEDEDLTPPLSEEGSNKITSESTSTFSDTNSRDADLAQAAMLFDRFTVVADSEETLTSPIIPVPPLVRIPSRSPHKSALASPDRKKKSPSPKRVQFVSQGSEDAEQPARGRRSKKLQLEPDMSKGSSNNPGKVEIESQLKTTGRRGRRSIQIETKISDETAKKTTRSSLPSVLEPTDSANSEGIVGEVDSSVADNEVKMQKGRKSGRNAKKAEISVLVTESESVSNLKQNKKNTSVVKDKKESEAVGKVIDSTNTRQSSRSKNKQPKTVESEGSSESSKGRSSRNKDVDKDKLEESIETPEISHRTRTKEKSDLQVSNETNKKGSRKSYVHNDISNKKNIETAVSKTTEETEVTKPTGKSKHKDAGDKSVTHKINEAESEPETVKSCDRQSRMSRRKGKETENNQSNEPVTGDNESIVVVKDSEDKQTKTLRRKGRQGSAETHSENSGSNDLKEITNMKNKTEHQFVKETKSKVKSKGKVENISKVEEKTGKVTRGKISGLPSGSGDAQVMAEQTPAKRRKTTDVEPQTVMTPKTNDRRVTTSNSGTPKEAARTPKSRGTKELDTSLSNSPSLRKADQTKPKVMFTGVTDEQSEKFVKELGGMMVSSVYECTHLVTDQIRRTVKFLCCLSRGVPILTPQWLMSSKRTAVFSDPAPFLIQDRASEKKFKFSLQLSLNKASDKPFLADYKVHVTKSVRPEPSQMKDIIQCAGAKYLTAVPKSYSDNTIVISCEDDRAACDSAIKAGLPVVSAEFILTGALRQEADLTSYLLYTSDKRKQSTAPDSEPSSKKRKR